MSPPRFSHAALLLAVGLSLVTAACGGTTPASAARSTPPGTSSPAVASPSPAAPSAVVVEPSPSPSPSTAFGDLDGLPVDPSVAHRAPIAVMIDDSRAARPQSGFNAASIVYQAPADGGETRYMLVYQTGESSTVGPVRSGRIYFVGWAAEYRAAFAHYGGDIETMDWIRQRSQGLITNVDALFGSAAAFHRIKGRKAPHNAYTSTADLRAMTTARGVTELDPAIHLRPFDDASPEGQRGTSQTIRIPYPTNVVTYAYDPQTNAYRRSVDGKLQVDEADGKVVTARNVVVLFQTYRIDTKIEPGHARPVIGSIGEGVAWVFKEGRLTKGRWTKSDVGATTVLVDASGSEIPLVRGNTYIQVVPTTMKVTVGG